MPLNALFHYSNIHTGEAKSLVVGTGEDTTLLNVSYV